MRIQCRTQELLDAVNLATGVIPSNPTRTILLSLLVRADDQGLVVQGTDLDLSMSVRIDGYTVDAPGAVVVPAGRFHSMLREADSDEAVIEELGAGQVQISFGSARFKISTERAEEFPSVEFQPLASSLRTSRMGLLDALRRVAVAAAKDATRFQMHSVLLDCQNGGMRLVSTDGKRLALDECPVERGAGTTPPVGQFIVPIKGVELLLRILSTEGSENVDLYLDSSRITYLSDRVTLSCGLVEGRFPPYERAIPEGGDFVVEFRTDALQTALRQAVLMTTKETNSVHFSFEGENLVLSTHASGLGESRIEMQVQPVEAPGTAFSITFNPHYLLDLIKVVEGPTLRGVFRDSKTAGVFSANGGEGPYRHIVMPLVTGDE